MIEVFKTNVECPDQAMMLIDQINKNFADYKANFDLHDCDNILRVKTTRECIEPEGLINFIKHFGFHAEVLPDECADSSPVYFSAQNY
jgi:hypothetical protein